MKPLNDKELSKIILQKLKEVEPDNTKHLWPEVEKKLPRAKRNSLALSAITSVALVALFSLLLTLRKHSEPKESLTVELGIGENRVENSVENFDDKQESGRNELKAYQLSEAHPLPQITRSFTIELELNSPKSPDEESLAPISKLQSELDHPAILIEKVIIEGPERRRKIRTKPQLYFEVSTNMTFHTLDPDFGDEVVITGDSERTPSLLDRTGVQLAIGRITPLIKGVSLVSQIGISYQRSRLYFQNLSTDNPQATFGRNALYAHAMLGFNAALFKNNVLEVTAGSGILITDHSEFDYPYPKFNFDYKLAYHRKLGNWLIGPFYSSQLKSIHHRGVGKITPHMYGLNARFHFR